MLSFFRKKSVETNAVAVGTDAVTTINQTFGRRQSEEERPPPYSNDKHEIMQHLDFVDTKELKGTIYDILRTIKDPEKPATLEDLNVVYEEGIFIQDPTDSKVQVIRVEFNPTVPHCSLATLIGLCIRVKIERSIPHTLKVDIYIKKGAHSTEDDINKQINDKERIAAAMENPNLRSLVEECIKEVE